MRLKALGMICGDSRGVGAVVLIHSLVSIPVFRRRITMCRLWILAVLGLFLAANMIPVAYGQETTGGIKGYVRDKSGASVAKADVEVSGPALLASRKIETDGAGYFYFQLLPPGEYTVSVTAKGFRAYRQRGISLEVGKLPTLDVLLEVGSLNEVVEVSARAPIVDTTTSKVAVDIPEEVIVNIPKGRSYQSLIPFAPGARQEPLQSSRQDPGRNNGFQIDGASDSENT